MRWQEGCQEITNITVPQRHLLLSFMSNQATAGGERKARLFYALDVDGRKAYISRTNFKEAAIAGVSRLRTVTCGIQSSSRLEKTRIRRRS